MRSYRAFIVLVACGALLPLAACSALSPLSDARQPREDSVSTMDLSEAKDQTLSWTSLLVDSVPSDLVADAWQHDEGVLMSCAEGAFQWASAAEITVDEEQDLVPLLEVMATAWTRGTGLPSSFEQAGQGGPRLALTGPDGAIIIVDGYDDGRTLALSTFSACVTDLADYDGGYSY